MIYKDKVQNYYPLTSQNIIEIFEIVDIVINTIPYNIIPEEAIVSNHLPYILDIASAPYGINQEIVKKHKNNNRKYRSRNGRCSKSKYIS